MKAKSTKTPEALVKQMYRVLLQREADAEGLEIYSEILRSEKMSFSELVLGFVESDEFNTLVGRRRPEACVTAHGCNYILPADMWAEQIGAEAYESWAIPYFLETCRPGMTVVDIGASWGSWALPAAQRVGETGRVLAVEVSPANCQVLARSARASALKNLEILPFGVSDRLGSELMPRQSSHHNNAIRSGIDVAAEQIERYDVVPVLPIDLIAPALGQVDIVKMDIEGMEYRAVKGGLNFFEAQRPTVFLEYSPQFQRDGSGVDGRDLLEIFLDLDYEMEIMHRLYPRETVRTKFRDFAIGRVDEVWRDHCEKDKGTHLDLCLHPRGLRAVERQAQSARA